MFNKRVLNPRIRARVQDRLDDGFVRYYSEEIHNYFYEPMSFEEYREKYPNVHDKPKSWERGFFKENTTRETVELCYKAYHGDIQSFFDAFCYRTVPGHINWWMDQAEIWDDTGEMPEVLKEPIFEALCAAARLDIKEFWRNELDGK